MCKLQNWIPLASFILSAVPFSSGMRLLKANLHSISWHNHSYTPAEIDWQWLSLSPPLYEENFDKKHLMGSLRTRVIQLFQVDPHKDD